MAISSNHGSWTDLLYINDSELVQKMVWPLLVALKSHRTTFKNYKTLHDHMGLKIPVVLANLYKLVHNKYRDVERGNMGSYVCIHY